MVALSFASYREAEREKEGVSDDVLVGVEYSTCRDGGLKLTAIHMSGPVEEKVHKRIWWKVTARDTPDRYFCTFRGKTSVDALVDTYALLDNNACMNIASATMQYASADGSLVQELTSASVADSMRDLVPTRALSDLYGIPQREANSGICWYAALMFVLRHNEKVSEHIRAYLPEEMRLMFDKCLQDQSASESLRELLWKRLQVGDPFGQAPELDGQNGLTQFYVLAGRLGMPVLRYFVDDRGVAHKLESVVADNTGKNVVVQEKNENGELPRLLTFRFRRGSHEKDNRVQPPRRKIICGKRYRLFGMMIGSEHCGHQIAACAEAKSWRRWAVCDSDAQHRGIGVTFWKTDLPVRDRSSWWQIWKSVVPTVRFSGGYCNLSPQNAPTHAKSSHCAGMTNVDFLYFAE